MADTPAQKCQIEMPRWMCSIQSAQHDPNALDLEFQLDNSVGFFFKLVKLSTDFSLLSQTFRVVKCSHKTLK